MNSNNNSKRATTQAMDNDLKAKIRNACSANTKTQTKQTEQKKQKKRKKYTFAKSFSI
jgi:hypothetical protein